MATSCGERQLSHVSAPLLDSRQRNSPWIIGGGGVGVVSLEPLYCLLSWALNAMLGGKKFNRIHSRRQPNPASVANPGILSLLYPERLSLEADNSYLTIMRRVQMLLTLHLR